MFSHWRNESNHYTVLDISMSRHILYFEIWFEICLRHDNNKSLHNKRQQVKLLFCLSYLSFTTVCPRLFAGFLPATGNCSKRGIKPELFCLSLVCVKGHCPFMTCHSESVINNVVSYTSAQKQVGLVKPMTEWLVFSALLAHDQSVTVTVLL